MPTKAAAQPPRRRLSGFCNPTLPRTAEYDPHQRCPGCDCRASRCPCNPEEPPVADDPTPEDRTHCLAKWPAAQAGVYDPSCCRFPKPCSVPDAPPAEDPDPGTPEDAVNALALAVEALSVATKGYAPDDWRDAVRLLRSIRVALDRARMVDATLVSWLYMHGEHGPHQRVEGVPGDVAIGRGRTKERWESAAGVRAYVAQRIDAIGGEYPDPDQVVEWVLEVLPATSSTSLRKTPLREAGLNVNDYYNSEPGPATVSVMTR